MQVPGAWVPFGLIVAAPSLIQRGRIRQLLERQGIETRPILAGNITQQPALQHYDGPSNFPVTQWVAECCFSVGCAGLSKAESHWLGQQLQKALG